MLNKNVSGVVWFLNTSFVVHWVEQQRWTPSLKSSKWRQQPDSTETFHYSFIFKLKGSKRLIHLPQKGYFLNLWIVWLKKFFQSSRDTPEKSAFSMNHDAFGAVYWKSVALRINFTSLRLMNVMLVKIIIHLPEMPKSEQQGAVVNVNSANWVLSPCASLQEDVNWPVNVSG